MNNMPQQQNGINPGNKQQTGTSPNPQNKTNQQNSTTKDYKNLNYQNFKTVSETALKYFNDQEQKFEDKAIDKFNSLNNFYNEITIKDEVQKQLALSSNKIVDFPNFGNLSIDSMESIDSNTDAVCKFSNQVYSKNKKNEKTAETIGGDTSVIKDSKIDEMQKAISTLVKYDLKRSPEPIIEAIRTTYSMDQSIKALNELETFLISDNIKTIGVNYTPKSIINLVIKMIQLNKDPNSQQLTQEEQLTRNEIFKILYDVLIKIQNSNIDSKIIVFYIESINNVKEFTDYCNQQQPVFNFTDEVNKYSNIVQATAQLNNNKPPTISQSTSSTTSKTADQIKDEIKQKIREILNHPEFKNETMVSDASNYEIDDDTKLTNRLSTQENFVAPKQIDQIQNDELKQLAKDVNDLISQYKTAITSTPQSTSTGTTKIDNSSLEKIIESFKSFDSNQSNNYYDKFRKALFGIYLKYMNREAWKTNIFNNINLSSLNNLIQTYNNQNNKSVNDNSTKTQIFDSFKKFIQNINFDLDSGEFDREFKIRYQNLFENSKYILLLFIKSIDKNNNITFIDNNGISAFDSNNPASIQLSDENNSLKIDFSGMHNTEYYKNQLAQLQSVNPSDVKQLNDSGKSIIKPSKIWDYPNIDELKFTQQNIDPTTGKVGQVSNINAINDYIESKQ